MYTINMADSTGLFIVLMIFCVMSITSSIFFTYTCTDGTWDFDNFEGEKCVKFPEEIKPILHVVHLRVKQIVLLDVVGTPRPVRVVNL